MLPSMGGLISLNDAHDINMQVLSAPEQRQSVVSCSLYVVQSVQGRHYL